MHVVDVMVATLHTIYYLSLPVSTAAGAWDVQKEDLSQAHEVCPAEGVQRGTFRPARAAHPRLLPVDHRGGECCGGFVLRHTDQVTCVIV